MPLDQEQNDDLDGGLLGGVMSLGSHLDELRSRLIRAAVVPVLLSCGIFLEAAHVRHFLTAPLVKALEATGQPTNLQVLSPTETLMVDLRISIWTAVIVSMPWILYQLWKFVSPGLYAHERRYARFLVPLSSALVVLGLSGLYLVLPYMLAALIRFGVEPTRTVGAPPSALAEGSPAIPVLDEDPPSAKPGEMWILKRDAQLYVALDTARADGRMEVRTLPIRTTGSLTQQFRLQEFVDFLIFFGVAIAIAFQMPVAVLLLGWIGVLGPKALRKYRKHAFLACSIIALVITPTVDVFSLLALNLALYLLYEFGIVLLVIAPAQAVAEGGVIRNAAGAVIGRPKYRPKQTDGDEGDE